MARRTARRKGIDREPTHEEWHEVLAEVLDPSGSVTQRTVEYFLRRSETGRAYLEGAKRLRPSLDIGVGMDLDDVISTYDTMTLLAKLIAEPRCGTDPEFYVWKDVWKSSSVGAAEYYTIAIEIAQVLEARSEFEEEKARLKQVRTALENEFRLEQYNDWRSEAVRKMKE